MNNLQTSGPVMCALILDVHAVDISHRMQDWQYESDGTDPIIICCAYHMLLTTLAALIRTAKRV